MKVENERFKSVVFKLLYVADRIAPQITTAAEVETLATAVQTLLIISRTI